MNKEKYALLDNAMELIKKDNGSEIYVLSDKLPEKEREELANIAYNISETTQGFDLPYEILNDAINFVVELELSDLEDENFDWQDINSDTFASVYTATRLSYLNHWNQDEISSLLKEYQCDISEACMFWYDERVKEAIEMIINWLNK